jgi:KEOPS complex subunit Pcc1
MSQFRAELVVNAKEKAKAIFDSVSTDNKFYPENPTKTKILLKKNTLHVLIDSDELPHLRANVNSVLRLIQASHDAIESVKI